MWVYSQLIKRNPGLQGVIRSTVLGLDGWTVTLTVLAKRNCETCSLRNLNNREQCVKWHWIFLIRMKIWSIGRLLCYRPRRPTCRCTDPTPQRVDHCLSVCNTYVGVPPVGGDEIREPIGSSHSDIRIKRVPPGSDNLQKMWP